MIAEAEFDTSMLAGSCGAGEGHAVSCGVFLERHGP